MKKAKNLPRFLGKCDGTPAKFIDLSKFANEFIPTQKNKKDAASDNTPTQKQNSKSDQLAKKIPPHMGMADLNFAPPETPVATLSICPTTATISSDESEDEEGQPLCDCSSEEHLKCGGLFPCPVGDCIGKVDIDELFSHVLFVHKIDIQYATKRMYAEAREKLQKQTKLRKEALYLPSSDEDSSIKEKDPISKLGTQ